MWKKIIITTLCSIVLSGCQKVKQNDISSNAENKKEIVNSKCDSLGTFSENDSVGSVNGIVVAANDTGNGSYSIDITLKDKNGVERKFYADYVNVPDIDFKKIIPSACINVEYTSESHSEEGVVDGRVYTIERLKY